MLGSSAYGTECCCTPGTCVEDKYDTVTQIEPGLWTINTRNDPAEANSGPAQNRAIIFKVTPSADKQQEAFLVMVNGVGLCNSSLTGLRALESQEGAALRHVVSSGDWHHVYLKDYTEYFPQAKVHVPPGRIPGLDEGKYKYELIDVEEPLAFLQPHLKVYLMKGLGQPFAWSTVRYEFFFFHTSTRTLVAGDIFFYFSCAPSWKFRAGMPGVAKGKISFWDAMGSSMFKDKTEGAKSAELMLGLDFERFISIHGELGSQVPPGAKPSAKELVKTALTTGRGPLSPWALVQEANKTMIV